MKTTFSRFAALLPLAIAACTNGQGQADVTMENAVTFPGVPASVDGVAVPVGSLPTEALTTDGAITVDVQDELESMGKLGTLSATVSKNSLSGAELSLIDHIKTTIATADGKMPVEVLTDVDVPKNATEIDLPLSIPASEVLAYLEEGKVTIHFYVTGSLSAAPVTLTHTLVAHVDVAVQGSVLKL